MLIFIRKRHFITDYIKQNLDNFWYNENDAFGNDRMKNVDLNGIIIFVTLLILALSAATSYVIENLISKIIYIFFLKYVVFVTVYIKRYFKITILNKCNLLLEVYPGTENLLR